MRKKINIVFIISLFLLYGCLNVSNSPIEKIINLSKNKDMELLLKYQIKTNVSPSGNFIFIYALGADFYSVDNEKELSKDALQRDFKIDNFNFKKGEYNWWFIYDCSLKKIIIKGTDLVIVKDAIWKEENNYFIFDFTDFMFYNLKEYEKKPFVLRVCYLNKNSVLFSKDSNYIAYQYRSKMDDFSGMPLEVGIKIRNIKLNDDVVTITPSVKNGTLEIIKWENEKKIAYKEIDENNKVVKNDSYEIK